MPVGKRVLYLSYDGMTDPLGGSQVLPYLTGLARRGHRISLISFEKSARTAVDLAAVRKACAEAGIAWFPKRYHKRPPVLSTLFDLARMTGAATRLHKAAGFDLVHCRSYLPALVGLRLKRKFGVPFLFDMRGFWPEEKTEGGSWDLRNPLFRQVYRFFKKREGECLTTADHIVSLTESAKRELRSRPELAGKLPPITVIPCCVDLVLFAGDQRAHGRAMLETGPDTPILVYLGSLGGNYMLGEMLDFFLTFREVRPGARFLFVTHGDPQTITQPAARRGIASEELLITAAKRKDVPSLLAAADLGIAFKRPSFSAAACSPTKIGEMMAMGLPVVANAGVGDVEAHLAATGAGVTIDRFAPDVYAAALTAALALPVDRIRETAARYFNLDDGVERYDAIYREIAS